MTQFFSYRNAGTHCFLRMATCALIMLCLCALTACGKREITPTARPSSSTSGPVKPHTYTVLGQTYTTMADARGFVEVGVASWYGKDFHGKLTANGEIYNMYGLTAAHRQLPFNTRVRVTNLSNGLQTIVVVNDRGPFVKNRIIDLTYTAAQQLDMLGKGTARVRLEAIDITPPHRIINPNGEFYVQLAAFGSRANAEKLQAKLRNMGIACRSVYTENTGLWRVQAGPSTHLSQAEKLQMRLRSQFPKSFVIAQ